jgi:hypothetical protein
LITVGVLDIAGLPNIIGPKAKKRAAKALPTLFLIYITPVGVAGMYSYTIILAYIKRKGAQPKPCPNSEKRTT